MKLRARWFLALGVVGVAGCDDPKPCNVHLRDGESFTVEVLGKADPALVEPPWYIKESVPSCGDLDDVEIGARFQLTLRDRARENTRCYEYSCPQDFPTPAEPFSAHIEGAVDTFICVNDSSKLSVSPSCDVARFVSLYHDDIDSIYEKPDANGISKVKLIRALVIRDDDLQCSTPPEGFPDAAEKRGYFCYDQWNVQLTPAGK